MPGCEAETSPLSNREPWRMCKQARDLEQRPELRGSQRAAGCGPNPGHTSHGQWHIQEGSGQQTFEGWSNQDLVWD